MFLNRRSCVFSIHVNLLGRQQLVCKALTLSQPWQLSVLEKRNYREIWAEICDNRWYQDKHSMKICRASWQHGLSLKLTRRCCKEWWKSSEGIYIDRHIIRLLDIMRGPSHSDHELFTPSPSGRSLRSLNARATRLSGLSAMSFHLHFISACMCFCYYMIFTLLLSVILLIILILVWKTHVGFLSYF